MHGSQRPERAISTRTRRKETITSCIRSEAARCHRATRRHAYLQWCSACAPKEPCVETHVPPPKDIEATALGTSRPRCARHGPPPRSLVLPQARYLLRAAELGRVAREDHLATLYPHEHRAYAIPHNERSHVIGHPRRAGRSHVRRAVLHDGPVLAHSGLFFQQFSA